MADIKWSAFPSGGTLQSGDQIVGLRSGDNYRFTTNPIVTWSSIAGTTQAAAINSGYIIANASQTTVTLPATAPVGSVVAIAGQGAAGWVLAPAAGQTIKILTGSASTSITSAQRYDAIEVVCIFANTTWVVRSCMTTGFVIL